MSTYPPPKVNWGKMTPIYSFGEINDILQRKTSWGTEVEYGITPRFIMIRVNNHTIMRYHKGSKITADDPYYSKYYVEPEFF